jgi:probable metal-binding protein
MKTIHIHDILDLIYTSGNTFTIDSLKDEVMKLYGRDVHFNSCADHRFGVEGMIEFMVSRGKINIQDDRIYPAGATYCDH